MMVVQLIIAASMFGMQQRKVCFFVYVCVGAVFTILKAGGKKIQLNVFLSIDF